MPRSRRAEPPWRVVFFQRHRDDDPGEDCPGQEFLAACPGGVAGKPVAILDAVAASPPPQFTGGGMWEAMHGSMRGYFEACTRGPDRRLYRLFCLVEQPPIVVITGLSKPIGTTFTEADYARVRRLGDEYRRRTPRNVV